MTAGLWAGYAALVALCWIGGVRLLRIALRTQEVTEWGLGVVLICAGGIGYPLLFLRSLLPLSPEASGTTFAVGLAALSLASIALYLFNWRLFRPHSVGAALLASAACFVIAWSFLAELLTVGFIWERDPLWIAFGGGARCLPYAWGSLEALLLAQAGVLRRGVGAALPALRRSPGRGRGRLRRRARERPGRRRLVAPARRRRPRRARGHSLGARALARLPAGPRARLSSS